MIMNIAATYSPLDISATAKNDILNISKESHMNSRTDPRQMTAETIGVNILKALITEIKLLPKVWAKIPQAKQDDVIARLRSCVEDNVSMAVHILASEGRTTVTGDLDTITIKDGVKALIKFNHAAEGMDSLYAATGRAVLVIVAAPVESYTAGMDKIKGESDQRGLDLGQEYHDNDGGGMGDEAAWRTNDAVIEGELVQLPPPVDDYEGPADKDPLYKAAVRLVIEKQNTSCDFLASELRIRHFRALNMLDQMEADGIISKPDANGARVLCRNEAAIRKVLGDDLADAA